LAELQNDCGPNARHLPVNSPGLLIHPVSDLPLVRSGDNLALLISTACERAGFALQDGDVLCWPRKLCPAEGRQVLLADERFPGSAENS
jgi:F420-0:gamma-glutamyl ligase